MKKLIIQIPCFNEEHSLPVALKDLPREVDGFDRVEWLIINDGSQDRTIEVAKAHGVDHVVDLVVNRGLAIAYMAGLDACLKLGADVIVNTDADNQYQAADIPRLTAPLLAGEAEIIIGERPITDIEHFSPLKKLLQRLGSSVVRWFSRTTVQDAPSGFRAMTRGAAMRLNVFSEYTYTLETIIQAGQKGLRIKSVPVRTNAFLRPSRLMKSMTSYIQRSIFTIFRIYATYRPLRFFLLAGSIPMTGGFLLALRWLWLFFAGSERAHVPSLVAAAVLILIGVQLWVLGFVADIISVNRKLLEDIQFRLRKAEYDQAAPDTASAVSASTGIRPFPTGAPASR